MKIKQIALILLLGTLYISGHLTPVFSAEQQEVKINILAVNPSRAAKITSPISQFLPQEIQPADILDPAGMEVKFDSDKKSYFLTQKVELEPLETKTLVVKIKNVWVISDEEIAAIQKTLDDNVAALDETDYAETARLLREKVAEQIGAIQEGQSKEMAISKRIELYRTNVKILEQIRSNTLSLEAMRRIKTEKEKGARTVKFIVKAENPSEKPMKMSVKALLPKDITADDVLDKLDFNLLIDEKTQRFKVEKQVEFEPKESKKYELSLRDIWYIPQEDIDFLKEQTEKIQEHFKGSNYEKFSRQVADYIFETLESITKLQEEVGSSESVEEKSRTFVLNTQRLDLAKKKLKELQDLLLQIPLKREVSQMEKIKQAIKKLLNVTDILKLGFKPDLSTTWWIILGIIAFILILSTSFYITWLTKMKDTKLVKSAGKKSKQSKEKATTNPPAAEPPAGPSGATKP